MAGCNSGGTKNIVRDIDCRLTEATGDQRETFWFMQILSLAVQHGNAASILCGEREMQRYFRIGERFWWVGQPTQPHT